MFNPKPEVYMNARGETVMSFAAFRAASINAILRAVKR